MRRPASQPLLYTYQYYSKLQSSHYLKLFPSSIQLLFISSVFQSFPCRRQFQESDDEEAEQFKAKSKALQEIESLSERDFSMTTIHKRLSQKPCGELISCEKYGLWRQEQRNGAAKLKKQLKAKWAIQKLIDEQLGRFKAHYSRAMMPTKLKDVAQLLMPKWSPAHEISAVYWMGDWRPSTILQLLLSLSSSFSEPVRVERALSQLINDIRIEEAVIDEEMAEIQANCILHLPFGPVKSDENGPPLARIRSEFTKIHRVIVKAQQLRMKTLDLAVKKVLSHTDAAEFLVAFAGIQDTIHQFAIKYKKQKGPIYIKEST